ncbi:site-specific integrase [Maridesulfovibrio sp.]|uniref:site-specific integrase n=1 Tax=Maridesulfovibrio sp. TaxID=2795000 RepID=UPI002AA5E8B6|nr:site-specific integrase [Maridesulfovibrio sp.]
MGLFLCLQGHTYHYRKVIPAPLRPYLGKREIKKSLQTGNKLEARRKSLVLGEKVEKIIQYTRAIMAKSTLSDETKKKIITQYFQYLIEMNDKILDDDFNNYPLITETCEIFSADPTPLINLFRNHGEEMDLETAIESHNKRDFDRLITDVKMSAEYNGHRLNDKDFNGSFLNNLSVARIDAARFICDQREGKCPITPKKYLPKQQPQINEPDSPLLQEVVDAYVEDRTKTGRWNEKSKQENIACYKTFIEFAGQDIRCADINYKLMTRYRDALLMLPPNINKSRKYRDKSIHEILSMQIDVTMSPSTVNKKLNRMSSLFKFAVKIQSMQINPAEKLELKIETKDSDLREVYTNQELQQLFDSPQYVNDNFTYPYMFWAIPIALFTGMRQTEIAQLYLDDIKQEDDIWYFDINDSTYDKKIKTKNAKRKIPMHNFLSKELNLPAFAQRLRDSEQKRLFPDINRGRDGYGQRISRWYNGNSSNSLGYKIKCGIKPSNNEAKKDFHSFRHTLINHLKQKLVDSKLLHEFDGHSLGSMTLDRYGKAYEIKTVFEEIVCNISFDQDLNLKHLKKSKHVLGK